MAVETQREELLTTRQVAEWLGISRHTALDWFETGKLPGFKLGHAVRFRPSEIAEWLEASRSSKSAPMAG